MNPAGFIKGLMDGRSGPRLHPGPIPLRRGDAGFDESNALHAVVDGRIDDAAIQFGAFLSGIDGARSLGVDRREGFEIPFRMARGDAADASGRSAGPCSGTGEQAFRFAERREPQIVRVRLNPFDAAFGTVNADLQAVLISRRHLTAPEHALGAAFEAQQHMAVVVKPAAFDEGIEIGGKAFERQPGDEAGEIIGMRADITGRTTGTGLGRVGAPDRLFGAGLLDRLGQPVLRQSFRGPAAPSDSRCSCG